MQPEPEPKIRNNLWIEVCALLFGALIPLGLLLIALALPSLFAFYNAVGVGQMLALGLVVLAGYLIIRTPIWVRTQQRRKVD